MKKVLSLVLALSLVLSTFTFAPAFAASSNMNDIKGEACEDAVTVLTGLGVVNGYEDGTYKPENIVTRAEMAVLVVNALGLEDYVTDTAKSSFTDMANYGWAEGYIAYAQSLGVISGYGDGTFKPGNTVSYDEASTMLVAALGYTADSLQGTWPANFVSKAKSLGILDGVKAGATGANRGDIAIMLYQTLDQNIGKVNKDGDWVVNATYKANGTFDWVDTMLDRLGAKLYKKAGDLDGDEEYYFIVTKTIADNESVINLYPYIGAKVSAYMNDDDDIIAVKEVKSTFLTGEFDGNDTFSVGDTDYDIKIKNGSNNETKVFGNVEDLGAIDTITNGALNLNSYGGSANFEPVVYNDSKTYTLAVDLSGKSIKDIYSISYWNATEADYFSSDDASDIKDDHELMGIDFPENDNGDIDTDSFELVGAASLDDIKKDNIVYVYENAKDEEIVRVAVGTEKVTGEVSKVSKNSDEYTIDGKTYKKSDVTTEFTTGTAPKAGDEVTLYLDAYGDVYDFDKGAGEPDKYAVVLKTGVTTGVDSDLQLKLFLADGSTKTFNVDDDPISGIITSSGNWDNAWYNSASGGAMMAGTIVKYDTDKNGVIDELEVAATKITAASDTNSGISAKGYFKGHKINSDAVIFTYDGNDPANDDNYDTAKYDNIVDSDSNVVATFALDGSNIACILLKDFSTTDDVFGVFTDWSKVSGDYDYEYTMIVGSKEGTKYFSDASGLQKAVDWKGINATGSAIYRLEYDASGALKDSSKSIASYSGSIGTGSAITLNTIDSDYTAKAYKSDADTNVLEKDGKVLKAKQDKTISFTLDEDAVIYKWNTTDEEYERGNINDLTKKGVTVEFYDVFDEDQVYDIVLVY